MTGRLTQITPFVCCSNMTQSIEFYCDVLGFSVGYQADNYAFVRRDDVALRLLEVEPDTDIAAQQNAFYIDTNELDTVYFDMKAKLDTLPDGRVRSPFNQDYGQREFHVLDPDGTLVFFGEAIPE